MRRWGLVLALLLILAVNVLALIGVASNRAGEAVETITLTERELPLANMDQENSGVYLRIDRGFSDFSAGADSFLDRARLHALGFDLGVDAQTPAKDIAIMPRAAYVALELNGEAWQRWLQQEQKRLESARPPQPGPERRYRDPLQASRLIAVDASNNWRDLRDRYPDQTRYLIVKAVVAVRVQDVRDPGSDAVTGHNFAGVVTEILPSIIHVPLPLARLVAPLKPRLGEEPRYSVTLKYGRKLEPWVDSIKLH